MCGIAGYSSFDAFDPRLYIALTNMGLHMQNRGRKSWGWTDGKDIVKSLGELESGWNYGFYGTKQAGIHTRHPTTGTLIEANSHPFEIGNVIGMHNGMVHNHTDLNKKYDRNCAVDSEQIFHHINDGLELDEISAYGAIVYWKDGIVHLGRFNNGDLTLARTSVAWLWASTEAAVRQSIRFAGLTQNAIICKLREDTLYRIVGDKLEVVGPLVFGSYSKSYGSWDDVDGYGAWAGQANRTYTTRSYSTTGSTTPSTVATSTSSTTGNTNPAIVGATVDAPKKMELPLAEMLSQMVIATTVKARAVDAVKEKGVSNVEPNVETKVSTTSRDLDKAWSCGACHNSIEDDAGFFLTKDHDILCKICGETFSNDIISGLLKTLPVDIVKMTDVLNANDISDAAELNCESCDSAIMVEDMVVLVKDDCIVCVDCFANGEAESDIADGEYLDYLRDIAEESVVEGNRRYEDDSRIVILNDDLSINVTDKKTGEFAVFPADTEFATKYLT